MKMAGKSQVDDSVIERRLRPIYDFLDNGNNKKAIQEADKALKKQPKLLCALVLKALAYLRLGREDQCVSILEEVVSEGTSDDATLQALTICYRELQKPEQICKLYENASKLEPNSEELLSHLFMSYVRIGDYKNQKSTAMQLYKAKAKTPYYFWAVMSTIMQSQQFSDEKSKKISLELAERMVDKIESMNELGSEEELLIYLYILELQKKYKEAVSFLDGPYCNKLKQRTHFIQPKKGLYLTKLGKHSDANKIYKSLIEQQPDNWQHYVNYINTLIKLSDTHMDILQEGSDFLNKMKEICQNSQYRSPLLCHLQLALKLRENNLEEQLQKICGDPIEYLFEYINQYGDKRCCYSDIINFLQLIKQDVDNFLERIKCLVHFDGNNIPIDIKNIYRHQAYLQLCCSLKPFKGNGDDYLQEGHDLSFLYNKTAHFSVDMALTDIRPNDTYLIMAMHNYISALELYQTEKCQEKKISSLIIYMCSALQHAINLSRANFQLKLILIKLYIMIGASEAACAVYFTLDLKHIQFDTLGYVMTFPAIDNGCFPLANAILYGTLKFFTSNYKDTSDSLIMSYKYGSFARIAEFIEFRDRLNNSLHFASCTAEQLLLEITMPSLQSDLLDVIRQLKIDSLHDRTQFEDLKDNRKFDAMNCWLPKEECLQESTIRESFVGEVDMLQIRNLILRIIGSICCSADDKSNVNGNNSSLVVNGGIPLNDISVLTDLISQLKNVVKTCDKYKSSTNVKFPIQGPDVPRLYYYFKQPYLKCFLEHCSIFIALRNASNYNEVCWNVLTGAEEIINDLISKHAIIVESLDTSVATVVPYNNKYAISFLTHLIQTISLVVVIIGSCYNILLSFKSSKKNRKKKGNTNDTKIFSELNKYVHDLQKTLQKLETAIKAKLKVAEKQKEINAKCEYKNIEIERRIDNIDTNFVCKSIEKSFCHTLNQLVASLSSKIKYLSSLKI